MASEITKYNGAELLKNIQDPMAAVEKLGRVFAQSGMFGLKTPEQGAIFAMTCLMEGKTPMEIMRTYHIIQGRPTMRADAMQAEFQTAGGRVRWDRSDDKVCTITLTHPEYAPGGVEVTVTMEEFEKTGLIKGKDNWRNFPKRMLQCRAISAGIRQVMPQIVAGVYTPEEAQDHFIEAEYEPATAEPAKQLPASEKQKPAQGQKESKPAPAAQAQSATLLNQVNKAIGAYKIMGVDVTRLEAKYGCRAEWTMDTMRQLKAAKDNIEAGHTTADRAFPVAIDQATIQATIAKFAKYGVIQSDLEAWVCRTYDPPCDLAPATEWSRDELAKLNWAAGEIIAAEDPMQKARELFELEPGAQG